jgi:hypothetical protein
MRFSSRRRPAVLLSAATLAMAVQIPVAHAQQAPPASTPDDTADACFSTAERAQPLLRQKKLREARALLESCARDACPRVARSDCREWLAEATDAQPSIVIEAHEVRGRGPVRDVSAVRAIIDDAFVVDQVDATPIVIDPGHHRLRLERVDQARADPVVQEIDVREGEKGRVVDVYWHVAATTVPSRPVPASVFVAGAVGLLAAGVGVYFEVSGLVQRHDLDMSCKPTATCTESQVNSARTQVRVGDIAVGGGLLFLATAGVLYLTRPATDTATLDGPIGWIGVVPGGLAGGARGDF